MVLGHISPFLGSGPHLSHSRVPLPATGKLSSWKALSSKSKSIMFILRSFLEILLTAAGNGMELHCRFSNDLLTIWVWGWLVTTGFQSGFLDVIDSGRWHIQMRNLSWAQGKRSVGWYLKSSGASWTLFSWWVGAGTVSSFLKSLPLPVALWGIREGKYTPYVHDTFYCELIKWRFGKVFGYLWKAFGLASLVFCSAFSLK